MQADRVIDYIRRNGSIDRKRAMNEIGVANLTARISALRHAGIPVRDRWQTGENRYGEPVKWKEYFL